MDGEQREQVKVTGIEYAVVKALLNKKTIMPLNKVQANVAQLISAYTLRPEA